MDQLNDNSIYTPKQLSTKSCNKQSKVQNKNQDKLEKLFNLERMKRIQIYYRNFIQTKTSNGIGSNSDERTDERLKHRTIFQNQLLESADRIVTRLKAIRKMIFLTENVEERLKTLKSNRLNGAILVKCLALIANEIPLTDDYAVIHPLRKVSITMCEEILKRIDRKRRKKAKELTIDYEKSSISSPYDSILEFLTSEKQIFNLPTTFQCIKNSVRTEDLTNNIINAIEDSKSSVQRFIIPKGKSFYFQHNDPLFRSPSSILTLMVNCIEMTLLDMSSIKSNTHEFSRIDIYPSKNSPPLPLYLRTSKTTIDKLQGTNDKMIKNQIRRKVRELIEKITNRCCGLIVHCKII